MPQGIRGVVSAIAFICASAVGANFAFVFESVAQTIVSESQFPTSYTSEPSESYAVELSDAQVSDSDPVRDAPPNSLCRAFYSVVAGDGPRTSDGTLCEQLDGSLRMVTMPAGEFRTSERASGYCREYHQILDEREEQVGYGTVCWVANGSWRLVTPARAEWNAPPPTERFARTYPASVPSPSPMRPPAFEEEALRFSPPIYRETPDLAPLIRREQYTREVPLRSVREFRESSALPYAFNQSRPIVRTRRWFAWRHDAGSNGKRNGRDRRHND